MLYEAVHVRAKGATITVMEIIVAVTIKGPAEAVSLGVVNTGPPDGQAHPPVTNIGPDKGPGGKDKLPEEKRPLAMSSSLRSITAAEQLIVRFHLSKWNQSPKQKEKKGQHQSVRIPTVTFFPWWDSRTLTRVPSWSPRVFRLSCGLVSCSCPLHMSKMATSLPSLMATPQLQETA